MATNQSGTMCWHCGNRVAPRCGTFNAQYGEIVHEHCRLIKQNIMTRQQRKLVRKAQGAGKAALRAQRRLVDLSVKYHPASEGRTRGNAPSSGFRRVKRAMA